MAYVCIPFCDFFYIITVKKVCTKKVQNFLKFYLKKSVLNVLIAEGQLAFWKGTHYVYDYKICFCNR